MGKSDELIFPVYREMLRGIEAMSVAFLGCRGEDAFTRSVGGVTRSFYDRALGNWDVNAPWALAQQYDLIVCTRCAYFAGDPNDFIARCMMHLEPGGHALVDFGLGDHWRFPMFKVGWVRDGEHEHAYGEENFLHSCVWRREFADEPVVREFWDAVRGRFGYPADASIDSVVRAEVPAIVDYPFSAVRFKFLWPESPQLYIVTLLERR